MPAFLQHWARANPLLVLAVAACAGILTIENAVPASAGLLAAFSVLTCLLALLMPRAWVLLTGCALVFGLLHTLRLDETYRHPLRQSLLQAPQGTQAVVRGSLVPNFDSSSRDRVTVTCEAEEIRFADGLRRPMRVVLQLRMPPGTAFPGAGLYELAGLLHLPRENTTPGAFDAADFALRSGFAARLDVETLRRLPGRGAVLRAAFLERAEACRQWMSRELTRDLNHDPRTAGVIRAMALGVADEAQEEVEDAFRDSGTLHVFAVSGLHVALLGLIAWEVLKLLHLGRRGALLCLLVIVFGYAFITGWRPSAARAAFMIAVVLVAPLMDRQAAVQNSLGLAALLLLANDTHQLFNPGFQLSFGVLWAIAAWSDHVMRPLRRWTELDPFLPPHLASAPRRLSCSARRWLAGTLSVSGSAWAGSALFILLHFQSVTPVTVLANCVLVPLSVLGLGVTCLSAVAGLLHLTGAQIMINNANWLVSQAMIASATWFAGLPGAHFHFQPAQTGPGDRIATWRVLDMPGGAAANHLRVGAADWLLDTGPQDRWRVQVKPYLRSQGVNSLAGIVLSHNDGDHIGAVEEISAAFRHPPLFCSSREPGRYDTPHTVIHRLMRQPGADRLHFLQPGGMFSLAPGPLTRATCLHPGAQSIGGRGDDRAMVLRTQLGPWRVLWMSDAGWHTEMELATSAADLRCDVLLQNRHESDETGAPAFLDRATPRVVITFSDPRRLEFLPSPTLAAWCSSRRVPLLNIHETGGILLEFLSSELRVTPARARNPLVLR
ncbi:MAG: ComEC/Rec2 family competence protein [Verrucomicrobiaceae bacterium]|nr:ComEC/Rec2 family competence protein [Verrucomicrobiaceae bacterium]